MLSVRIICSRCISEREGAVFVIIALVCSTSALIKSRTSITASKEKVLPSFKCIFHCVNQPPNLGDLKHIFEESDPVVLSCTKQD